MSGRRGLSDDERAIWATFTQRVKPLRRPRKAGAVPADPVTPRPASRKAVPVAVPPSARAKPTSPAKPPPLAQLSRREKQRVARGRDKIDARLDLHGHTQAGAHVELLRFLRRASAGEAKLVLVITGKSGVLRQQVPQWLASPEFRELAVSAESAAARHGGEGALYVRLRRVRQ